METSGIGRRNSCFDPMFIVVAIVSVAIIIAAALAGRSFPRGSGARIALAVVQGLATSVVIIMPLWRGRHLDELQQRIQLEALALAFFGTGTIATCYSFLESAGLPRIDWGVLIWPAMAFLWAIGIAIANRRYR